MPGTGSWLAVDVGRIVPGAVAVGAPLWLAIHHQIPPITITTMTTHRIIFPVFDMIKVYFFFILFHQRDIALCIISTFLMCRALRK